MAFDFENIEKVYEGRRIPDSSRKDALHYYEMRHDGRDMCTPVTIEKRVGGYFWGTLVTRKPVPLRLEPEDFPFRMLTRSEGIRMAQKARSEN